MYSFTHKDLIKEIAFAPCIRYLDIQESYPGKIIRQHTYFAFFSGRGLTIVGSVIKGDYLTTSVEVDEYEEVTLK